MERQGYHMDGNADFASARKNTVLEKKYRQVAVDNRDFVLYY